MGVNVIFKPRVSSSMTLSSQSWFLSNSAPVLVLSDNWNRQTNPFTVMLVISQSTTQSWTISSLVLDANRLLPPPHPPFHVFFIILFWRWMLNAFTSQCDDESVKGVWWPIAPAKALYLVLIIILCFGPILLLSLTTWTVNKIKS